MTEGGEALGVRETCAVEALGNTKGNMNEKTARTKEAAKVGVLMPKPPSPGGRPNLTSRLPLGRKPTHASTLTKYGRYMEPRLDHLRHAVKLILSISPDRILRNHSAPDANRATMER
jgi:hypothetical protein